MSKTQRQIIPNKIVFKSINIIKAVFETTDKFRENPQQPSNFKIDLKHQMDHDPIGKFTRCRVFYNIAAQDENEVELGLEVDYGIEFILHTENFDDFVINTENDHHVLDLNLGATLLGLAYSTARGIVFERTKGTYFNGIILPVIDPTNALQQI